MSLFRRLCHCGQLGLAVFAWSGAYVFLGGNGGCATTAAPSSPPPAATAAPAADTGDTPASASAADQPSRAPAAATDEAAAVRDAPAEKRSLLDIVFQHEQITRALYRAPAYACPDEKALSREPELAKHNEEPLVPEKLDHPGNWTSCYGGLDKQGFAIPRAGLHNSNADRGRFGASMRAIIGRNGTESIGRKEKLGDLTFIEGSATHFGGAHDRGVGPTETGTLTGERLRAIGNGHDPQKDYFCAMRLDYRGHSKSWWKNRKLLVYDDRTGRAVVCRLIDWGPHVKGDKIIDISPPTFEYLGHPLKEGIAPKIKVAFAAEDAQLGPLPLNQGCQKGTRSTASAD